MTSSIETTTHLCAQNNGPRPKPLRMEIDPIAAAYPQSPAAQKHRLDEQTSAADPQQHQPSNDRERT
jgi:hypothetical protein